MAQVIVSVAASADDADERNSGLSFNSTDTVLDLGGGFRIHGGLRFVVADIEAGDTIDAAILDVACQATEMDTDIKANDVDDANDFATEADVTTRVTSASTTASVVWTATLSGSGASNISPDFKAVVQEVVDRAGWASGNGLVVLLESRSTSFASIGSWNHATYPPAEITIDYTASGGVASGGGSAWYYRAQQ